MKEKRSAPPIIARSLDVQAAEVIRDQILNGTLSPGTRLLEVELAEQFNLSRGTIRSALQQLTHEGLVVQFPYRGCAVAGLTSQDAWELDTLRSTLEGLAARLAAESITSSKVDELQVALHQLAQATLTGNWRQISDADFALHKTILQLSGHRRLQEQYTIVEQQIRLYIISCNALNPNLQEIVIQHEQLVNAICSGDASEAEHIAKGHNTDSQALIQHLKTLEQQSSDLKLY